MSHQVVTANKLRDGSVVYLADGGGWTEWIAEARVATDEAEAEAFMAEAERSAEERIVVGPYLIAVNAANGSLKPLSNRERIRTKGPTVRKDLGKQAVRES